MFPVLVDTFPDSLLSPKKVLSVQQTVSATLGTQIIDFFAHSLAYVKKKLYLCSLI